MRFWHQFLGEVTLANPAIESIWDCFNDEDFVEVVDDNGHPTRARVRTLELLPEPIPVPESHQNLNLLADEILAINVSKGFSPLDEEPNIDQMLLLAVGEIIEAQDELRSGHAVDEVYYNKPKLPSSLVAEVGVAEAEHLMAKENEGKLLKPEGFVVEIADAIIRLLHICARLDLDIDAAVRDKMAYNLTREHRHGKAF